jgi:outer membrane protein TolC
LSALTLVLALVLPLALVACAVGPDYVPEAAPVPNTFKELKGWKVATPADALDRGDWWAFYRDPKLAFLLKQVEISNQTVAAQAAAYEQARAVVREAQAALFPTVSATYTATRAYNGPKTGAAGAIAAAAASGHVYVDVRSGLHRRLGPRRLGQSAAADREQRGRGASQRR